MEWEVGESATHPGYYSAEAVDPVDGEIYTVIFLCPESHAAADAYAGWKNRVG